MLRIDEKTQLPLAWIFVAAPAMIGAIMWITTIYIDIANAKGSLYEQSQRLEKINDLNVRIDKRLSRIEYKLGIKQGD